mmetsp:Transcript_26548/g.69295  ORF Transcript_26548/g.69295 Transcript_26548/m.69295 type:complete len:220 (-) Transcript_26548:253-912(-)
MRCAGPAPPRLWSRGPPSRCRTARRCRSMATFRRPSGPAARHGGGPPPASLPGPILPARPASPSDPPARAQRRRPGLPAGPSGKRPQAPERPPGRRPHPRRPPPPAVASAPVACRRSAADLAARAARVPTRARRRRRAARPARAPTRTPRRRLLRPRWPPTAALDTARWRSPSAGAGRRAGRAGGRWAGPAPRAGHPAGPVAALAPRAAGASRPRRCSE